ncbi:MAG: hypothetical protein JWN03_6709 [Nocardia sp.]|nr:hypothetical protein [Nocardia sp.]
MSAAPGGCRQVRGSIYVIALEPAVGLGNAVDNSEVGVR